MISGQQDTLIDYYVEAVDGLGNIARSDIQHVYVGSSVTNPGDVGVQINPDPAMAGDLVSITYDPAGGPLAAAANVYLHYGFNNWGDVAVSPDPLMNWNSTAGLWDISVPVSVDATQLDLVFNDGAGTWDNNNGQDWHFDVTGAAPPSFVMDGQLDATAQQVAANAGRHLYAALEGDVLYVATEDAGEGNDVFIYLAESPGALTAANWAKAGLVAAWDAYLADENDNDYEGWFDATGAHDAATGANGGVLEGLLNLRRNSASCRTSCTWPWAFINRPMAGARLVAAGSRVGQCRREHRLGGILSTPTGRLAGRLRQGWGRGRRRLQAVAQHLRLGRRFTGRRQRRPHHRCGGLHSVARQRGRRRQRGIRAHACRISARRGSRADLRRAVGRGATAVGHPIAPSEEAGLAISLCRDGA